MVSQAGGAARKGLLPVVHSFACFLSDRPNEQIFNNATERTKVVYVGSLAGLVPGGPGHSHQCVRDIAALSAIPGLVLIEPCCEREVALAVEHALSEAVRDSVYLRLVSVPWDVPFELPRGYRLMEGRGVELIGGRDAVLFAYGPVMLGEAVKAAALLRERHGVGLAVINLPWLNRVDAEWLAGVVREIPAIFTLDNHLIAGGQGDMLLRAIAELLARSETDRPPAGRHRHPDVRAERRGPARARARRRKPERRRCGVGPAGGALTTFAPQVRALKRAVRRVIPVTVDHAKWPELLGADFAEFRRRLAALPADAPRVLLVPSTGHPTFTTLDSVMAVALTLRGARVDVLLCDEALPACHNCLLGKLQDEWLANEFLRHGPSRDICHSCYSPAAAMFETLGVRVLGYSDFLGASDIESAWHLARTLTPDEICAYTSTACRSASTRAPARSGSSRAPAWNASRTARRCCAATSRRR